MLLLVAGCGEQPPAEPWRPQQIFHDFGMIRHGRKATERLRVDLPTDRGPIVPLGFQGNCSCATWQFVAVAGDGSERYSLGRSALEHAVVPGETLFLELTLDTTRKEAFEQRPITSFGQVIVSDLEEQRTLIPVAFTYGIDVPVHIRPFAHVDFGLLAESRAFSVALELSGKDDMPVRFGPATADDPRLQVELDADADPAILELRFVPDPAAGRGAVVVHATVATDLPDGYTVVIPVSGQVVDDIQITPMDRISFGRFDLAEARESFVNLLDQHPGRTADFHVRAIRTVVGSDLARHVRARIVGVPGDDQRRRLILSYLGSYRDSRAFRGYVDLSKDPDGPVIASVEFVGFGDEDPRKQ